MAPVASANASTGARGNCGSFKIAFTSFARIAANDPNVQVYFGPGTPATDGKRIRLRPPMELGRLPEHERLHCGVRDPDTRIQKCSACHSLDIIFSSFFHEIAHMIADSFASVDESDRVELVSRTVAELMKFIVTIEV